MGRRGRQNFAEERFYFVTTTVVKFIPIFSYDPFCDILIENIKYYQKRYKYVTLCYVVMPTHIHWIVKTEPEYGTISDIMRDIKKLTAWKIFDIIEVEKMVKLKNIFMKEAEGIKDQKRKLWMKKFDDEVI